MGPGLLLPYEGPVALLDTKNQNDESSVTDTAVLNRKISEAWQLYKIKERSKARGIIDKAFAFSDENKVVAPFALYQVSAEVAFSMSDYRLAYEHSEKALAMINETKDYRSIIMVGLLRSKVLTMFGKFSESLDLLKKLAGIAKENDLDDQLPVIYRETVSLYSLINDRENQRHHQKLMLEAATAVHDTEMMARAWFIMGEYSMNIDSNLKQSTREYLEALRIREHRHDSVSLPVIMSRIGWNNYLEKKYDTSMAWFIKASEIAIAKNDYNTIANSYGNIGTIYRDQKNYKNALEYYGKSSAYSLETKDWFNLSWVYADMSDLFRETGDYKRAYESYKLYKQYNDSLKIQKYNTSLADARMRYETEAKEKELELLELKLDQQRYYTYGFAALIILAAVIGYLLFRQSRLNNRRKISEMNRKISEITQANLRQQMNPHFIFNTLNSIQYYMYQHDRIATNNYLTKFSSLMRKILENSQHTFIPIRDELDALNLYLELETLRFKDKFRYHIIIDDDVDTLLFKIPTMLLQPYVENSIVHGLVNKEGKGNLTIGIQYHGDYLICLIEDDGIGREAAQKIKQSKAENHHSLGLKITESRVDLTNALYGTQMKITYTDLKDEAGKGCGTRVEIQIPVLT
jgi:tetratricopeptide (TPR) repeat protein